MSQAKPVAVVIDDEPQIRRFLSLALEAQGYTIYAADTAQSGIGLVNSWRPDFVILDLKLPDADGLSVLANLRSWYTRPIVILSVRDDESSIVAALDAGADDYLTKPFNLAELLARLRVAERHRQVASPCYHADGLEIDLNRRQVRLDGEELTLTATEFELLKVLVNHAGRVLTHVQILKEIWGPAASQHREYLRVYVARLRHKIEREPSQPRRLITEAGVGYRFASSES